MAGQQLWMHISATEHLTHYQVLAGHKGSLQMLHVVSIKKVPVLFPCCRYNVLYLLSRSSV